MNNLNYIKNNKLSSVLLFIAFFSYLLSFYFGENSTGAAILDYNTHKLLSKSFAKNFIYTLQNFENFNTRHSPILPIILSIFEYFELEDSLIRFFYYFSNISLPFIFYKILKLKFPKISNDINFFLISLIFLSPVYRSLSVWPDSRIWGLVLFSLSIYFFLKFKNQKKFKYVILNIFYLSLASYVSPNFSVFAIFYFFNYFQEYKFSNKIFLIFFLNAALALPALYFIFVLEHNFLLFHKAIHVSGVNNFNYFNKILIIPAIIFFYIMPFLYLKIIKISNIKINTILVASTVFFVSYFFFNYPTNFGGGGIFFQISNFIFDNKIFFYFISFISIVIILSIFNYSLFYNLLILFILILSNIQLSIYHKYYDPLLIILFFSLFDLKINFQKLHNYKIQLLIFSYFAFFLIISLIKSKFL